MLGAHLEFCAASVVVCSMRWLRSCVIEEQRMGRQPLIRRARSSAPHPPPAHEFDALLAQKDERLVVDSYTVREEILTISMCSLQFDRKTRRARTYGVGKQCLLGVPRESSRHPLLPFIVDGR